MWIPFPKRERYQKFRPVLQTVRKGSLLCCSYSCSSEARQLYCSWFNLQGFTAWCQIQNNAWTVVRYTGSRFVGVKLQAHHCSSIVTETWVLWGMTPCVLVNNYGLYEFDSSIFNCPSSTIKSKDSNREDGGNQICRTSVNYFLNHTAS